MNTCTIEQARAAKPKAMKTFGSLGTLTGVGITRIEDGYGLKVNLEREPESPLPAQVDGVPVRVEVTGRLRKQAAKL